MLKKCMAYEEMNRSLIGRRSYDRISHGTFVRLQKLDLYIRLIQQKRNMKLDTSAACLQILYLLKHSMLSDMQ